MSKFFPAIGLIGYGSFGAFLSGVLPESTKQYVYDVRSPEAELPKNLTFTPELTDLKDLPVVFLAIPISSYRTVLPVLKTFTGLIVDVSSVKKEPTKLFDEYLGTGSQRLMTHPLFGPESAKNGLQGHKFIVTEEKGEVAADVVAYFESLGTKIVRTSANEHDRQMAYTHVLTFFVSRALLRMRVRDVDFSAPSFQKLLALEELESHHSDELFMTIQRANSYGSHVRSELISVLQDLHKEIEEELREDNGH